MPPAAMRPPTPFPFRTDRAAIDLDDLVVLCEAYPQEAYAHLTEGRLAEWLRAAGHPRAADVAEALRSGGPPALVCVTRFLDGCRTEPRGSRGPEPATGGAALAMPVAPAGGSVAVMASPQPLAAALAKQWDWLKLGGKAGARQGGLAAMAGAFAVLCVAANWDRHLQDRREFSVLLGLTAVSSILIGFTLGGAVGFVIGAVWGVTEARRNPTAKHLLDSNLKWPVRISTALLGMAAAGLFLWMPGMSSDDGGYLDIVREGDALRSAGSGPAAIEAYDRAIALRPRRSEGYVGRGAARLDTKAYPDAVADLTRGIEKQGGDAEKDSVPVQQRVAAYQARARAYMGQKDYPRAIADLTAALKFFEFDPALLRLRAECHQSIGERARADSDFAMAAKIEGIAK